MTAIASLNAVPRTAYECLDIHSFGDTPVLVFASTQAREPEGNETTADVRTWQVRQRAYLAGLAARSRRSGGLVLVPNSTHSSMTLGRDQAAMVARPMSVFLSRAGS